MTIMPANNNDFEKIQEILNHLMVEFPQDLVEHKFIASRLIDIIFLFLDDRQVEITIATEFLKANDLFDIEAKLVKFQLADNIRKKKPPHITLTNSGLKIFSR